MSLEHPDITSAQINGYGLGGQPADEITDYDREEFVKDNAGSVVRWLLGHNRDALDEYINEHEAQLRLWLN